MRTSTKLLRGLLIGILAPFACLAEKGVWLEAEGFKTLGGWELDQQSTDQMGSAYLMAHGMGIPVSDAQTTCAIPGAGVEWRMGSPEGEYGRSATAETAHNVTFTRDYYLGVFPFRLAADACAGR